MAADPQSAVAAAEPMETIWFPIDGFELVCDVCGEHTDEMFVVVNTYWVVCKHHREAK